MRPAYIGESNPQQCEFELYCEHERGHKQHLNPRLDLRNHSPTGLSWGYAGSGPAQTALAILCHATNDDQLSLRLYQQFKAEVIARQPDNFILTHDSVIKWVEAHRED